MIVFKTSPIITVDKFIFYLSLSLPISIISGPFLPDLTVVLLALFSIYIMFPNNYQIYKKTFFFYLFLIFYVYIITSSFISDNYFFSFHSSVPYIRFLFFVIIIKYIVDKEDNFSKYLFYIIFIIFTFFFFDTLYYLILNQSFLNFQNGDYWIVNRFHSIMHDKTLGSYIIRLLPLLLAIYLRFFRRSDIILFALIIMTSLILFTSGERAAIVMFVIFIVLFPLSLEKKILEFYIKLSVIVISFIGLILYFKKEIFERVIYHTFDQLIKTNNNNFSITQFFFDLIKFDLSKYEFYLFSPAHQKLFLSAFEIFKNNFFFGGGPRMYRLLCLDEKYFIKGSCNTHPHNFYVQFLSEMGIIGFFFLTTIFFYISYSLFKFIYNKFVKNKLVFSNSQYLLLLGFFITLWPINTHGNFFNNLGSIIMFFPLGFYLSNKFSIKS